MLSSQATFNKHNKLLETCIKSILNLCSVQNLNLTSEGDFPTFKKIAPVLQNVRTTINSNICGLALQHTAVSEAQWIVGLLQWKIGFKSPNFSLKSKRLNFFVWSQMALGSHGLRLLATESVLSGQVCKGLLRGLLDLL